MAAGAGLCPKMVDSKPLMHFSEAEAIPGKPHVLIVWTHEDERGVFSDRLLYRIIDSFRDRVGYTVRKIATEADLDIAIEHDSKRADVLLVGGHGNSRGTRLAKGVRIDSFKPLEKLSDRCRKIVLYSCSTGSDPHKSLAARVARKGKEVLAPTRAFFPWKDSEPNILFHSKGGFPVHFTCGRLFSGEADPVEVSGYEEDVDPEDRELLSLGDAKTVAQRAANYFKGDHLETALFLAKKALERAILSDDVTRKQVASTLLPFYIRLDALGRNKEVSDYLGVCLILGNETIVKSFLARLVGLNKYDELESLKGLPMSECVRSTLVRQLMHRGKIESAIAFANEKLSEGTWITIAQGLIRTMAFEAALICMTRFITDEEDIDELFFMLLQDCEHNLLGFFPDKSELFRFLVGLSRMPRFAGSRTAAYLSRSAPAYYLALECKSVEGLIVLLQHVCKIALKDEVRAKERDGMDPFDALREVLVSKAETSAEVTKLLHTVWEMHGKDDLGEGMAFGPNHLFDSPFLFSLAMSVTAE